MVMRKQRRRIERYCAIAVAALSVIAIVAVVNYGRLERDAARIPAPIRKELTFSPFVLPVESKGFKTTDYRLTNAENNTPLLSYVITSKDVQVTISEYPQPPQFTDIPEYKERFLSNVIKQYATVQTANGTIYLGRQEKQNNKQLAIMIERGLIVLMNPAKDLTDQQWRAIGEQLEIQKIES